MEELLAKAKVKVDLNLRTNLFRSEKMATEFAKKQVVQLFSEKIARLAWTLKKTKNDDHSTTFSSEIYILTDKDIQELMKNGNDNTEAGKRRN